MKILYAIITISLFVKILSGQTFETRNKIDLKIGFNLTVNNQIYNYNYSLTNSATAKESVYIFDLRLPTNVPINNLNGPLNWGKVLFSDSPQLIRWIADVDDETDHYGKNVIGHSVSLSDFSFNSSNSLPGILIYYSEGWAPAPVFEEGDETDTIPGYTDLTPYGPGVVGKTVGPVQPPIPFVHLSYLDTLIAYTHQSAALGWLKSKQDEDSDDGEEKPEDGIVNNLAKRLQKAKTELVRGDSVKARKELGKFLKKVETIHDRSVKAEQKKKEDDVIMTSESFALLKYNGEYLLERLPAKTKGRNDK